MQLNHIVKVEICISAGKDNRGKINIIYFLNYHEIFKIKIVEIIIGNIVSILVFQFFRFSAIYLLLINKIM